MKIVIGQPGTEKRIGLIEKRYEVERGLVIRSIYSNDQNKDIGMEGKSLSMNKSKPEY